MVDVSTGHAEIAVRYPKMHGFRGTACQTAIMPAPSLR
jgi:hypothetical protein